MPDEPPLSATLRSVLLHAIYTPSSSDDLGAASARAGLTEGSPGDDLATTTPTDFSSAERELLASWQDYDYQDLGRTVTATWQDYDYQDSGMTLSGSWQDYDYRGALFFVLGLLSVYGLAILFLIISLIRKSRSELELVDHLQDFEAIRRKSLRSRRGARHSSIHSPRYSVDDVMPSAQTTSAAPTLSSAPTVSSAPTPSCSSAPQVSTTKPGMKRPLLQRSRRLEHEEDDDLWLNYNHKTPGFNKPRKIINYNPSLLRDDTFDNEDMDFDFIII